MEVFLIYLSTLVALLPLSLYFISFMGITGPRNTNLPPGTRGWPILGETMEFPMLGPQKFDKNRMVKYLPEIFQTSLFLERTAIFCGAQGNKFVFTNDNKVLTSWWPQSLRKIFLVPQFLQKNIKDVSALQHRFYHDIFKLEALRQYIPLMDAQARDHLDHEWTPNEVVKVLPLTKKYTFELGCKLMLGVVDPEHIKRLADCFGPAVNGMLSVPIDFPGTNYTRAIKAGKTMLEELIRIIRERRKEMMMENKEIEGRDLLSKMLLVTDEDGHSFSDLEIFINIIGLLVASFDTTSSAVTSVMNFLAQPPHIYEKVLEEQMKIAKLKGRDELLTWEDIEKMKFSWNVARESLRLIAAALGGFRETTAEFTCAGFTIPKGWKIFWTVHSSHKNPKYFREPEKFDASRFDESGPAPYTFVPLGGGPGMCPGKEYAKLEILVFMHNVVTKFKHEKTIPDEKIVYYTSAMPECGLPVRLQPHGK